MYKIINYDYGTYTNKYINTMNAENAEYLAVECYKTPLNTLLKTPSHELETHEDSGT